MRWPSRMFGRTILIVTACSAVGAIGCASRAASPPATTVLPEPVRSVLAQTSIEAVGTNSWVSVPFTLSTRGILDITLDWTHPDSWIYAYLGDTTCDYAALSGGSCPFLIKSEVQDPKPRVLQSECSGPGTYYLFLHNLPPDPSRRIGSANTETVSMELGLTVSHERCGPAPRRPPSDEKPRE